MPAKKNRVSNMVAGEIVGALLKETAEYRVFEVLADGDALFTGMCRKLVLADKQAKAQPAYRIDTFRPLAPVAWEPLASLYGGPLGEIGVKTRKHRLTVSVATAEAPAKQAQALVGGGAGEGAGGGTSSMKWTFYVPISEALFAKLESLQDALPRMKLLFDEANHGFLKNLHTKPNA